MTQLPSAAIPLLKNALSQVYYFKDDLKDFLIACLGDRRFVSSFDWDQYKRHTVSDIVNALMERKTVTALLKLAQEVSGFTDFSHLAEHGQDQAARQAVRKLSTALQPTGEIRGQAPRNERLRKLEEERKRHQGFDKKLSDIKTRFLELTNDSKSPQQRGKDLEEIMHDLFRLFVLEPRRPYRGRGEQVDGAFRLDETEYLFEAKWHRGSIGPRYVRDFTQKVTQKLDNTLGLFLSIEGFTGNATEVRGDRPKVILMDGPDLMAVLEGLIGLDDLLRRKRRHASQEGEIYIRYQDMDRTE